MPTLRRLSYRTVVPVIAGVFFAAVASAQSQSPRGPVTAAPPAVTDPPIPQAPATVTRASGQVVVRAIHLTEPLTVDGKLDESAYRDNLPVDGFIQTVPANGRPVSERTEAWVMYDDTYLS